MNKKILFIVSIVALFTVGCPTTNTTTVTNDFTPTPIDPTPINFDMTAKEAVLIMDCGWNLGNTLDAYADDWTPADYETCWKLPKTTAEMMTGLAASGIKTVRIPISWHNHVDSTFTIDSAWLNRVQEVVDYAIDAQLCVIINIHHDNNTKYYFPDSTHEAQSLEYVTKIWNQVAERFKDYSANLIFETLNEPRIVGYTNEWNWSDSDSVLVDAAKQINTLNQAAVNTIRAAGGNNDKRFIMFTPYVASPWSANSSHFTVPADSAEDKLILSIHAYTPYNFAMEDPGIKAFGDAQKSEIDNFMNVLNSKFITGLNIPVVIGEYGATNKNNLAAREAYFAYYVSTAHRYGICPIVWDNGNHAVPSSGSYSELYGYYNRTKQEWYFPTLLEAIVSN